MGFIKKNKKEDMENAYIGALWANQTKSGVDYLSGYVEIEEERIKIQVWENKNQREGKRDPEYSIKLNTYEAEEKKSSPQTQPKRFVKDTGQEPEDDYFNKKAKEYNGK